MSNKSSVGGSYKRKKHKLKKKAKKTCTCTIHTEEHLCSRWLHKLLME